MPLQVSRPGLAIGARYALQEVLNDSSTILLVCICIYSMNCFVFTSVRKSSGYNCCCSNVFVGNSQRREKSIDVHNRHRCAEMEEDSVEEPLDTLAPDTY